MAARTDHTPLQVFTVAPPPTAPRNVPAQTQRLWSLDARTAREILETPPRIEVPSAFDARPDQTSWTELERAYERPLARFWRRLLRALSLG